MCIAFEGRGTHALRAEEYAGESQSVVLARAYVWGSKTMPEAVPANDGITASTFNH